MTTAIRSLALILFFLSGCASRPDRTLVDDTRRLVDQSIASGAFTGVALVAHEGRPLLHVASGKHTTATRFDVASLGKMFTSVAVAQLAEQGLLSFDEPVGRYLPDFPNREIASKVTIHHLLTHTSAIPDLPDDLFNNPPPELRGYLPFFERAALEFAPGAQRAYSNSGFVLLGLILEQVTKTPYERYVAENVFARAGMSSVPGLPHGGARATSSDLMKFFAALRDGRLVKPETATLITTPRNGASSPYGFGTIDFDTDRLVGHSGGSFGISADAYTYWKSGYTIVVLSDRAPPASHDVAKGLRNLIEPRFATR